MGAEAYGGDMNNFKHVQKVVMEGEECAECGTGLLWHLKQKGNRHVYLMESDELLCSRKCFNQFIIPSYQIFNKQIFEVK